MGNKVLKDVLSWTFNSIALSGKYPKYTTFADLVTYASGIGHMMETRVLYTWYFKYF